MGDVKGSVIEHVESEDAEDGDDQWKEDGEESEVGEDRSSARLFPTEPCELE